MDGLKTKVGAGVTLAALGGLTAFAVASGNAKEAAGTAAASRTQPVEVRTQTVHRTVRVTKRAHGRHGADDVAAPAPAPAPAAPPAAAPAPAPAAPVTRAAAPAPAPVTTRTSGSSEDNSGHGGGGDDGFEHEAEHEGEHHGGDDD